MSGGWGKTTRRRSDETASIVNPNSTGQRCVQWAPATNEVGHIQSALARGAEDAAQAVRDQALRFAHDSIDELFASGDVVDQAGYHAA